MSDLVIEAELRFSPLIGHQYSGRHLDNKISISWDYLSQSVYFFKTVLKAFYIACQDVSS